MDQQLFAIALAGPALFVTVALVLGFVTPGYRPVRNTISELALGVHGWVQAANFAISGLLIAILGALLLDKPPNPYAATCVLVLGVVLLVSAVVRTDPIEANGTTTTGKVHNGLFLIGMLAMLSAELGGGIGDAQVSVRVLSAACLVASGIGLAQVIRGGPSVGLFQRILVVAVMAWITVFAVARSRGL